MKKLFMTEPTYFNVVYDINPWMNNQIGKVDIKLARQQWANLCSSVADITDLEIIPSAPNTPDLVFAANAGFPIGDKFILSRFSKQERQPEEFIFYKWFSEQGYQVVQPVASYEGQGDHLVDSLDRHWVGTGFRTSKDAAEELNNILNTSVTVLELVDPRWYHLDTCFCPLPNGEIMWYPYAFSISSQIKILESFETHVFVNYEDAIQFACNAVCIDNKVFLPKSSITADDLRELNYEPYEFDMSEFMKSGGAVKCLILENYTK